MIFDADAHISLTESDGQTAETLLRHMDLAGIEKALVWLQPPYDRDIDKANLYVYQSSLAHSDRLIPFGWVDPHDEPNKALVTVRKCLEEYGMPGVKMNGAQNSFYIDDLVSVEPLIEEIQKHNAVLALHIGADFYEFTHPFRAAKIASRHPQLRMLLAHMGGAGLPDVANACIEFAKQYPNMLLIGSAVSYLKVKKAIVELGAHRVCFGADSPFAIPKVEVAAYRALLEDILSPAEQEMVMSGNLIAFLRNTRT